MSFFKKDKKSYLDRYRSNLWWGLLKYLFVVSVYLIFIYKLPNKTAIEIISVLFVPILLSFALRLVDVYIDSMDPFKYIKNNQELYNLGIITYDQYSKRKNEMIEEVNSRYPYNEAKNKKPHI